MTPEQLALIRALRLYSDREGLPLRDTLPRNVEEIPTVRDEPTVKRPTARLKKNDKGEWIRDLEAESEQIPMRKRDRAWL